ncbi:MAG: hypothetical protein OHK0050_31660 [Roseiflexaceae bacterium]
MPSRSTALAQLTLRIHVRNPLPGVDLRMQRGRDQLIAPIAQTAEVSMFELQVALDYKPDGTLVLRGPEVQGPPHERFVYINAGTSAGQADSSWTRRAKVPLSGITAAPAAAASAQPAAVLAATIAGRGRDGGPAAATVPLLDSGWHVVAEAER